MPLTTGFPIRNSPDQSLFGSSPKHIAAFHVLHQLLVPRHPPCTLNSLITQFLITLHRLNCVYCQRTITTYLQLYKRTCGDERDRTANLCLAKAALSQLSYTPQLNLSHNNSIQHENGGPKWIRTTDLSLIRGTL